MTDRPPNLSDQIPAVTARPLGAPPLAPPTSDLELPYLTRREALLDLMLVLLVAIILPYLPMVLAPFMDEPGTVDKVGPLIVIQTWCQAGLGLTLLCYLVRRHGIKATAFGVRFNQLGRQLFWSLGALASTYVALLTGGAIVMIAYLFVPELEDDLTKRLDFLERMPVENLGITLTLLLAVSINEELLFRGLLLPYLRRLLGGWWWAAAISAGIFAALHIPQQGFLGGGIQIFAIGLVLSLFFILSRSLLAVIIAHLLFNFFQFQLIRYIPNLDRFIQNLQG